VHPAFFDGARCEALPVFAEIVQKLNPPSSKTSS
jgi:hypothetical protein